MALQGLILQGRNMERSGNQRTDGEPDAAPNRRDEALDDAIEQIRRSLAGLRFGQVTIVVQDGVVVQVERTERRRLRRND
jgi:hypothetical protein